MRKRFATLNPFKLAFAGLMACLAIIFGPISFLTLWGKYKEKTIADRLFPDDHRVTRQYPRRHASKLLEERQFRSFPEPLVRHAYMAGWQGIPSLTFMRVFFDKATIISPIYNKPISAQIRLLNSARVPDRIMQYRYREFGVPTDYVSVIRDGKATIRTLIGGMLPGFSHSGPDVDKALLVAWLAEAVLIPGGLIEHKKRAYDLTWIPINERSCGVTISYNGVEASGVFTINEEGFVQSFTTDDMVRATPFGYKQVGWTMTYAHWYGLSGIAYPGVITCIWHEDDTDTEYFSCSTPRFAYW